ncbi:MAG: DUF4926 domain-containing protein [Cytophagaceae bacterium]|nr:DUF4926 domain-containing protein [Cytophagaceae bacterium]
MHLFDIVILTEELPDKKLRHGNIGTVVEILATDAFLVEFVDSEGRTYAEEILKADQLWKTRYQLA